MVRHEDGYTGEGFRHQGLGVDFDGVIHRYSKQWHDGTIYDPPHEEAISSLRALKSAGYDVVIHTARDDHEAIRAYLREHGADEYEITCRKPHALAYIDDRAFHFVSWTHARAVFLGEPTLDPCTLFDRTMFKKGSVSIDETLHNLQLAGALMRDKIYHLENRVQELSAEVARLDGLVKFG